MRWHLYGHDTVRKADVCFSPQTHDQRSMHASDKAACPPLAACMVADVQSVRGTVHVVHQAIRTGLPRQMPLSSRVAQEE